MSEKREHDWKTSCGNGNCGGTCFTCCCGFCKVCGAAEGATTTECPGEQMSYDRSTEVYEGKIDFVDGQWQAVCSPFSPAAYRRERDHVE